MENSPSGLSMRPTCAISVTNGYVSAVVRPVATAATARNSAMPACFVTLVPPSDVDGRAGQREEHHERGRHERHEQRRFDRQPQAGEIERERRFANAKAVDRHRHHLYD